MNLKLFIDNPQLLVGTFCPDPECKDILLKIVKVNNGVNATYDKDKVWRDFFLVQVEDGNWIRYWLTKAHIEKPYENQERYSRPISTNL